jgi:hypothetical protein
VTLANLSAIAIEILNNHTIPAGSVIMIGSASHLFKVGASSYATDWVGEVGKLEHRFKNVNFCPLAPILRDNCPGSLVQDIETLTVWYHKVYDNNIKGLLTCWDAILHFAQHVSTDPETNTHEVLSKLAMPKTLRDTVTEPTMIRLFTNNPATLPGMSCTVENEMVKILLSTLQKDFLIASGPEVILQRPNNMLEDMKPNKTVVCIGSSILQQQIPLLKGAGYTVVDLTRPGWIATDKNINTLIKNMSELTLEPGFSVILDLFGNSSYRYTQFDGTLALPYKEGENFIMRVRSLHAPMRVSKK